MAELPAEKRARLRGEVSRLLNRLFAEADLTRDEVARELGTRRQVIDRWVDSKDQAVPGIADLPLLPREVALALLGWIAENIGTDAPAVGARIDDDPEHLARLLHLTQLTSSFYADSIVRGRIHRIDAEKILHAGRPAQGSLGALLNRAQEITEEQTDVVRMRPRKGAAG